MRQYDKVKTGTDRLIQASVAPALYSTTELFVIYLDLLKVSVPFMLPNMARKMGSAAIDSKPSLNPMGR